MTLLETAMDYRDRFKLSVIPIKPQGKTPLIDWKQYQERHPTDAELTKWFSSGQNNIGIVTGAISNIAVIDFDSQEAMKKHLPFIGSTVVVKTGKGCHAYVQYPPGGVRNFQKRSDLQGIDLRGDGGYVVAPPSIHPNGNPYIGLRALGDVPMAAFPGWVQQTDTEQKTPVSDLVRGVSEGGRNDALARVAGSLFFSGMSLEEVNQFAQTWNTQNDPPLPEEEVLRTVKSIGDLHSRNKEKRPNVDAVKEWPTLPGAARPGLVGEFVHHACERSEADPAAVLATFLVRFGTECGTFPHVMVGEAKHFARTNAVIVGESSKARKGTSATPVAKVFFGLIDGCASSKGPLSTGEGLIHAVRDELQEWVVKKDGAGAMVVKDPGIADKRLYVQDEELASALQATKREGNTLSPIIRCLWDDGNAAPLTKTSKTKTTGAHVGVITHITHDELKKLLTVTEQLNGFGNRFLWVCSKRQKILSRPGQLDLDWLTDFQRRLQGVLTAARTKGQLTFSEDAWTLWDVEYPRLSMAYGGAAGCMVNRGEAQVIRLSLIYALIAGHGSIEAEDLKAALAFWEYCNASALYLFGGVSNDKRKSRVLDLLNGRGELTKTEVRTLAFSKHIDAGELDALLSEMAEQSLIVLAERKETGGAPCTVIRKNPSAL